ncbi:hypothetical protein OAK57_01290 [Synechococcus sp. AH-551-N23]|nr:hypothetical protein [Synechococcus sp. AH-551-N23]
MSVDHLSAADSPLEGTRPPLFLSVKAGDWVIVQVEQQVAEHIAYLDLKIDGLNKDLENIAGGVLDNRDDDSDLRDRLMRELEA